MSLMHEAFNLYVESEREHWGLRQGEHSPASLTFENWCKYSTNHEYWLEQAQKVRESRPKSTKQLNDEHLIKLHGGKL